MPKPISIKDLRALSDNGSPVQFSKKTVTVDGLDQIIEKLDQIRGYDDNAVVAAIDRMTMAINGLKEIELAKLELKKLEEKSERTKPSEDDDDEKENKAPVGYDAEITYNNRGKASHIRFLPIIDGVAYNESSS